MEEVVEVRVEDVVEAEKNIRYSVKYTECTRSQILSQELGFDLYFKHEFRQVTGSYKERGVVNIFSKLSPQQSKIGVIAASAGNHALALCYHGQRLNIPVTVCMPVTAPFIKVSRCKNFGANVISYGENIMQSKEYSLSLAKEKGLLYVNGYDHPSIIAGQGTIGAEILEQVDDIDAIVVPIGGGGLIAGIATFIKSRAPNIKIIGVESELCPGMKMAIDIGEPCDVSCSTSLTIADGLCVQKVGSNSFATLKTKIDQIILVEEKYIFLAILKLLETEKCVIEGAGAVGLAAFLSGKLDFLKGKRVVTLLTGSNIDVQTLEKVINRGLAIDNRLRHFKIEVSDRPGGISQLMIHLSSKGANIIDVQHERSLVLSSTFNVNLRVTAEFKNKEHYLEVKEYLQSIYNKIEWL